MAASNLTAERVRKLLDYNPDTGILTWRIRTSGRAPAGAVAGCKTDRYIRIGVDGTMYSAHRIIWLWVFGHWPRQWIDHVDSDKTNNRLSNLRDVTASVNMQNQKHARSCNRTGLLGVGYNSADDGYRATIMTLGKSLFLGTFDTPEEAHAAYLEAKRRLHVGNTL